MARRDTRPTHSSSADSVSQVFRDLAPASTAHSPFSHDEIAERAYELFLARGSEEGHALDDWLEAERMLARRGRTSGRVAEPH